MHHRGFGAHADACAPGIVALLDPVRARDGLVLELGCGSGQLTRHLVDAGHRVLATDASSAMLDLARATVPGVDLRRLVLPDDPFPHADAVVSVGHVLSYLSDEDAIERALTAAAEALRPGGVLALDLCDLRWGEVQRDRPGLGRTGEDWAIITARSRPTRTRFVRDITTFVRDEAGSWRRGHERHVNVLVDPTPVPELLARHGVRARVEQAIGGYTLPDGLVAVVGERLA